MPPLVVLGIDCGGTHTDAALLEIVDHKAHLLASAKTPTLHSDLTSSIVKVIKLLKDKISPFPMPEYITLGTTLEINAIIQDLLPPVGLALSAGPGLDPIHFGIGTHVYIVPGGLDHRGMEVTPLYTAELENVARKWVKDGVKAISCVSKFSPRNDDHEQKMAKTINKITDIPVIQGHELSGALNFPRRIATAYYSASVKDLHNAFLENVEKAIHSLGLTSALRLLKADGGAIPFQVSRKEPAQSILSGPAASVMGCLALWEGTKTGCALLIDIGGTTSDLSLFLDGSPVVDRTGMAIKGRRTLVRSLAATSIGIGGDSLINIPTANNTYISVGPVRKGPAMAFGGEDPTLLDALNYLDQNNITQARGNIQASIDGISQLAKVANILPEELASQSVKYAMQQIGKAAYNLIEGINSKPIYTLKALKSVKEARPTKACVIGGPAQAIQKRLEKTLGMPVTISPHSDVANAIGAALTLPTAQLEIYADTGTKKLSAPGINYKSSIPASYTLEEVKETACQLLKNEMINEGFENINPQVTDADLFATLDDYGRGAKDMRVTVQLRPGIRATTY